MNTPSPTRYQQVRRLFDEVVELDADRRHARLAEIEAEDAALRAEVEALLAADEATHPLLGGFAERLSAYREAVAGPDDGTGRKVSHYHLLERIGVGGMGVVYLAEREDIGKRVALKLVRGTAFAPEVRQRFRLEQRVLARLEHPGIARLLDAGVANGETPFFAMEYVAGEPITAYCDRHGLNVEARLRLFVEVCEAVAYAHRNLVVHRDLKPNNILVTEDGRPKLLDFGIAKLIEEHEAAAEAADLTRTGAWLLTPQYAAPEQVRSEAITTATDVYSLGVILYELLTGRRPYDVERSTPSQVERTICETDPPRPSAAASDSDAASARRLRKRLQGDLDAIVLKALQKEPARRYASAAQLAQDLQRYLKGQPVQARPETLAYRAGKFARRHRWSVAAAAAFVLLLAGYAVTVTLQARKIAEERDRARLEAMKTMHVTDFLIDLFGQAPPGASPDEGPSLEAVLASGAERVRRDLADQPEIRAEMLSALGAVYQRLGRYDAARPLLTDALQARREHFGPRHAAVAASLSSLAALEHDAGQPEAAEAYYREALALQRTLHGDGHIAVAEAHHRLARLLDEIGQDGEAAALYAAAVPVYRRVLGSGHGQTARLLRSLAALHLEAGAAAEAEPLLREALDREQERLGPEHPAVAVVHGELGAALAALGRYAEAEEHLLQSHALLTSQPDRASEWEATTAYLVTLYEAWGRPEQAEPYRAASRSAAVAAE